MIRSDSARVIDNSISQHLSAESNGSQKVKPERESAVSAFNLDFAHDDLLKGMIMAEVLGKPKSLRRSRR